MNTRFSKILFAHLGLFMFSFVCLSASETRGCDLCGFEECWYIDDNQVMSADFPIDLVSGSDNDAWHHAIVDPNETYDVWHRAVPESNSRGRQSVSRLTLNGDSGHNGVFVYQNGNGHVSDLLDWISQQGWLDGPMILGGIVVGNPADLPDEPKKFWSSISQRATWTGPMDAIIYTLIDIEDYLSRDPEGLIDDMMTGYSNNPAVGNRRNLGGNLKTDDDR